MLGELAANRRADQDRKARIAEENRLAESQRRADQAATRDKQWQVMHLKQNASASALNSGRTGEAYTLAREVYILSREVGAQGFEQNSGYILGFLHITGDSVPKDWAAAVQYLEPLVKVKRSSPNFFYWNDPHAAHLLTFVYSYGGNGIAKDEVRARELLSMGAELKKSYEARAGTGDAAAARIVASLETMREAYPLPSTLAAVGDPATVPDVGEGSRIPSASFPVKPNIAKDVCPDFTLDNYRTRAFQGGARDNQLFLACGEAFEYYNMYLNAIRQGYSEKDANRTHAAHVGSAYFAKGLFKNR